MHRHIYSALFTFLFIVGNCSLASIEAHAYLIGVNQSRIMWMNDDERLAVLSDIASHKVSAVRIAMNQPFSGVIDAIELANIRKLPVLLVVSLNTPEFYPEGERKRPAPENLARIIRDVVRFGGPRFSVPACM